MPGILEGFLPSRPTHPLIMRTTPPGSLSGVPGGKGPAGKRSFAPLNTRTFRDLLRPALAQAVAPAVTPAVTPGTGTTVQVTPASGDVRRASQAQGEAGGRRVSQQGRRKTAKQRWKEVIRKVRAGITRLRTVVYTTCGGMNKQPRALRRCWLPMLKLCLS
jgi:hypothetical protein